MSSPAVLCDTGALLDFLVSEAPDHHAFRAAINDARTRYIPALVLAEVDYFLREERVAMSKLIEDISRGAFTFVPSTIGQLTRAMEIDGTFAGLDLGLVDASIVAAAEELGVTRVLTRDVRHYSAVTLRSGRRLELVVNPTSPESPRKRRRAPKAGSRRRSTPR